MKTYFFTVKHEHWRNGTTVAMTAGVVRAASYCSAEFYTTLNGGIDAFTLALTNAFTFIFGKRRHYLNHYIVYMIWLEHDK